MSLVFFSYLLIFSSSRIGFNRRVDYYNEKIEQQIISVKQNFLENQQKLIANLNNEQRFLNRIRQDQDREESNDDDNNDKEIFSSISADTTLNEAKNQDDNEDDNEDDENRKLFMPAISEHRLNNLLRLLIDKERDESTEGSLRNKALDQLDLFVFDDILKNRTGSKQIYSTYRSEFDDYFRFDGNYLKVSDKFVSYLSNKSKTHSFKKQRTQVNKKRIVRYWSLSLSLS